MTILTKPKVWRADRPVNETRRSSDLTPAERENLRAALRFLRVRLGGCAKLAEAMRANVQTLQSATRPRRSLGAGLALRAARVAGVPVEDVLSGAWPGERCPHCGRE